MKLNILSDLHVGFSDFDTPLNDAEWWCWPVTSRRRGRQRSLDHGGLTREHVPQALRAHAH